MSCASSKVRVPCTDLLSENPIYSLVNEKCDMKGSEKRDEATTSENTVMVRSPMDHLDLMIAKDFERESQKNRGRVKK